MSRHMPGNTRRVLGFAALLTLAPLGVLKAAQFSFIVGDVISYPGATVEIPILAESPTPYQGLSLSVRYPPAQLQVEQIGIEKTIFDLLHADFVHGTALPEAGLLNLGVLVDALPPFDGKRVPATDYPLEVARITGRVLLPAPGEILLAFDREAQQPAVQNVFVVENNSQHPERLVDGRVTVERAPMVPAFIRGDFNLDRLLDISDPIALLAWRFLGDEPPGCEDAADANADDALDVSDGIHLLYFLFLDGDRPLPPQRVPGPDPRAGGNLGCQVPLEWQPARL